MKVQPGQSVPTNLEQPKVAPKERLQTLKQAATKVAIVVVPVMLVVATAIIAGRYFSSLSNPITPDPTITVESYNGEKYLCTVANSCLENLKECVDNLKGKLHYGYGTQQMEDGSTRYILWSTVPENCVRL